jgi:hypothetical protein
MIVTNMWLFFIKPKLSLDKQYLSCDKIFKSNALQHFDIIHIILNNFLTFYF